MRTNNYNSSKPLSSVRAEKQAVDKQKSTVQPGETERGQVAKRLPAVEDKSTTSVIAPDTKNTRGGVAEMSDTIVKSVVQARLQQNTSAAQVPSPAFTKEVDGVRADLPARSTRSSDLKNSILSTNSFGSLFGDWKDGSLSGRGREIDPTIEDALSTINEVAGKGHHDARAAFGQQTNELLTQLGLRDSANAAGPHSGNPGERTSSGKDSNSSSGKTSQGGGKVFPGSPMDISLYANDGGTPDGGHPDLTPHKTTPEWANFSGKSNSNPPPEGGMVKEVKDSINKPIGPSELGITVGSLVGGIAAGAGSGVSGPPKNEAPVGSSSSAAAPQNAGEKAAEEAKAKAQLEQKKKEVEEEKKQKELKEKNEKKYVDPDQAVLTAPPSPEQIEARLNGRKLPVNPNGGYDGGHIDDPSVHPVGGIDPTVAYVDNLLETGQVSGEINIRITTAPIDPGRDSQPVTGEGPSNPGDNERR